MLCADAFRLTNEYDNAIANFFDQTRVVVGRTYTLTKQLKYGCNPHQSNAAIYTINGQNLPFSVLNGDIGIQP